MDRLPEPRRSTTTARAAARAARSGTTGGCGTSRSRASRRSPSMPLKLASYIGFATAARRVRLRRVRRRQDASSTATRSRGYPTLVVARAVPGRRPADGARHHRRVPGADVHRGQAAPALPRAARAAGRRFRPRRGRARTAVPVALDLTARGSSGSSGRCSPASSSCASRRSARTRCPTRPSRATPRSRARCSRPATGWCRSSTTACRSGASRRCPSGCPRRPCPCSA